MEVARNAHDSDQTSYPVPGGWELVVEGAPGWLVSAIPANLIKDTAMDAIGAAYAKHQLSNGVFWAINSSTGQVLYQILLRLAVLLPDKKPE